MLCVIAYCAKDKDIAIRQAKWLSELGGLKHHDCLLVVHSDTDTAGVIEIARATFNRVAAIPVDDSAPPENNARAAEHRYIYLANKMWERAARHIALWEDGRPWFWLEPDAVPLVPDWLDEIKAEYEGSGKPFLLDRVVTPTSVHNSGVGVYPKDVMKFTLNLWKLAHEPFDVFFKDDFSPFTHHTMLIHDKFYAVWDDPKSGEPTFPDADSLKIIENGAVLFHRNKDGSLIQRLREKHAKIVGVSSAQMDGKACFKCGALWTEEERWVENLLMRLCLNCGCDAQIGNRPSRREAAEYEFKSYEEKDSRSSCEMNAFFDQMLLRIAALEAAVFPVRNGVAASVPVRAGNGVLVPSLKPPRLRRNKPKPKRSAAEQAKIDARMAKARAARKPVAA